MKEPKPTFELFFPPSYGLTEVAHELLNSYGVHHWFRLYAGEPPEWAWKADIMLPDLNKTPLANKGLDMKGEV